MLPIVMKSVVAGAFVTNQRIIPKMLKLKMILFSSVPSAYPAGLVAPYATRPGSIFDYGLEPSIIGKFE